MKKESIIRNCFLMLSYAVVAASLYEAQKTNIFDGFDSFLGSSADESESSASCWDDVEPWEAYGGFILYFLLMCYIFLGFEVCLFLFHICFE